MDAKLKHNGDFFDLALLGGDLESDAGLETATIVSLFTDRLADPGDELPDNTSDRRGWWGDAFALAAGDLIGSKLWLLGRSKHLPAVADRAEDYAREALRWLIDDGIAAEVAVIAEWYSASTLALGVEITRPDGTEMTFRFDNIWEAIDAV
jgi:phage gp46-like protein